MNGALIIDKPVGITSHDVVNRLRRLTGQRRIGHIGTLDPFATGILVLLLGKATRLARFFDDATKSYAAVMRVGFATDTYDATGVAQGPDRAGEFDLAKLEPLLAEFRGTIPQKPPAFSAKKIAGVAAYKKARKRQDVELPAVPVTISELLLIEAKGPLIRLSVTVSSGTYIRSLANDLGARLGVGAHLTELRRSSVGNFRLDQAARLEQLDQPGELERHLIPMENLLTTIPARSLDSGEVRAVLHGQPVAASSDASWLRLMAPDGRLVAMAQAESPGSYHPKVVLCEPTAETSASTPAGVVAAKAPAGSAAE